MTGLALTVIVAILVLFVIAAGGRWDVALGIAILGALLWVAGRVITKRKGPVR